MYEVILPIASFKVSKRSSWSSLYNVLKRPQFSLLPENPLEVQEEKPKLQRIQIQFWLVHNSTIAWNDAQTE